MSILYVSVTTNTTSAFLRRTLFNISTCPFWKRSVFHLEGWFGEKMGLAIRGMILVRYDIVSLIWHIISNIQYIKWHTRNRNWISHLLRSIILNFPLEYVVFLRKYVYIILPVSLLSCTPLPGPVSGASPHTGPQGLGGPKPWELQAE